MSGSICRTYFCTGDRSIRFTPFIMRNGSRGSWIRMKAKIGLQSNPIFAWYSHRKSGENRRALAGEPLARSGRSCTGCLYHLFVVRNGVILLILNVRGMMRHDDRFTWLIGNHHLLHHKYPQYNYGEYWLDWLGGTLYPLREEAKQGLIYI